MVAFLAGCGSDVSIGPGEPKEDSEVDVGVTAGSRLRPVMAVADGVAAFMTWRDTELGVDCRFRRMVDGVRRCIPVWPSVVFTDAACTKAAFIESPCRSGYEFAGLRYQPEGLDCDINQQDASPTPFRRVAASVGATSYHQAYTTDAGLQCAPEATPLADGEVLVAAEQVPLDTFVAAERVVIPGSSGLGRAEWHAEDGAREVLTAVDLTYDAECVEFDWATPGRCLPTLVSGPRYDQFADQDCTGATAYSRCGEQLAMERDECSLRVFEVGEALEGYYTDDQACTFQPGSGVHRLGIELSIESMPRLTTATFGPARLKARYLTDSAGWRVATASQPLFDSELGDPCVPARASDGSTHCTPAETLHAINRFSDAQCTQRVHVQKKAQCFSWGWLGWYDPAVPFCQQDVTSFEILDVTTASTYYERAPDGACIVAPIDDDEIAYELGPPRTVDSFPKVQIEVW